MPIELVLSLAGVLIIPIGALSKATYNFVQKVNRHDLVMEDMKNGIDRVESKVDLLTEVILTRNLGGGADKR